MKYTAHWSEDKKTYAWGDFWLILNDNVKVIRENIWNSLLLLEEEKFSNSIKEVIKNYVNRIKYDCIAEILEFDFIFLERLINKYFTKDNLGDCDLVREYVETLKKFGIPSEKYSGLENSFASKLLVLKDFFTKTPSRRKLKMDTEEYEEYRKNKVKRYIKNYQLKEVIRLYDRLCPLIKIVSQHESYLIRNTFSYVVEELVNKSYNDSIEFLKYIITEGNSLRLQPHSFLSKILNHKACEPEEVWNIVNEQKFSLQHDYMETYFIVIPETKVNEDLLKKLIDFYKTANFEYLDFRPDNLNKFEKVNKNIYLTIIKILWDKTKRGQHICFDLLFNPYSKSFKNLEIIFRNDIKLFKEIYFYEFQRTEYSDNDGAVFKTILKLDNNFLIEFLDLKYSGERYLTIHHNDMDLRILWTIENYEEILSGVIEYHIDKKLSDFLDFFSAFFIIPEKESFKAQRESLLINQIEKYSNNTYALKLIFRIIVEILPGERNNFIARLISINQNVDVFKSLILEPFGYSGKGGSFVPALIERRKFWQDLLPLFNGIEFLEHKRYVEEYIDYYDKRIRDEKIRDFTDDFLR